MGAKLQEIANTRHQIVEIAKEASCKRIAANPRWR